MLRRAAIVAASIVAVTCTTQHPQPPVARPAPPSAHELPTGSPESQGVDSRVLFSLTQSIASSDVPLFSLLISRNGVLVYELYTASIAPDDAHYVMSITKSVLSALVGIAIDSGAIQSTDQSIVDLLPHDWFASDAVAQQLRAVTLADAMGMSAFDAPVPPVYPATPVSIALLRQLYSSPNRARFALTQPLLPTLGTSFQYNPMNPMLTAGVLQWAVRSSALEFAEQRLFGPLGFRNYEWMHQDPAGIDNGAVGLRLRPIDMQKFGILYLQNGQWNHRQILSETWVRRSLTPWVRSTTATSPDYGWYWWTLDFGSGWVAHVAIGWKGQRIAVFPAQRVVVTMTGAFEEAETVSFGRLITRFVMPAVRTSPGTPLPEDPTTVSSLDAAIHALHDRAAPRISAMMEARMLPRAIPFERHRPFRR